MKTEQNVNEPLPASDLLGCPFCGRPPRKETFSIHCDFCCVTMDVGHRSIIQHMWMNWNKRAGQPNAPHELPPTREREPRSGTEGAIGGEFHAVVQQNFMNAIELYHQDGKSTGVFYCTQCRCVKRTKEEADKCCEPTKCQYCGKESGRQHWLCCDACQKINDAKKEADRFEKAKKLTDWDGWVYLDGTGRDGYSESLSDFWDNWECDHDEGDEKPAYVWACKKNHFAVADVSDITERIGDNAYEDFDTDDLNGLDDLKAAIEKFNEANKDVVSYEPDYGVAILLNDQVSQNRGAKGVASE